MLWNPASSASHRFILSAFSRVSTSPVLNAKRDRDYENLLTFPCYQGFNRMLADATASVFRPCSEAIIRRVYLTVTIPTLGTMNSLVFSQQPATSLFTIKSFIFL